MSRQIVMEYINCNERKHLIQECYEYNDFNKWFVYAKEHIYYHLLIVIQGVEIADQEMINIWKEYGCDEEEEEINVTYYVKTWDMYGRPYPNFNVDGFDTWDNEEDAREAFEGAIDTENTSAVELIMVEDGNEETIDEWETLYELPEEEEEEEEEGETDVESITDN